MHTYFGLSLFKGTLQNLQSGRTCEHTVITICQLVYPCFLIRCFAANRVMWLARILSCQCRLQQVPFRPCPVFAAWRKNCRRRSRKHRLESVDEQKEMTKSYFSTEGFRDIICNTSALKCLKTKRLLRAWCQMFTIMFKPRGIRNLIQGNGASLI